MYPNTPNLEDYCRLRCLFAYYFNGVTRSIDTKKESIRYEFTFMSYFNFLFPHGNNQKRDKLTFTDIHEVCDYINDKQKA